MYPTWDSHTHTHKANFIKSNCRVRLKYNHSARLPLMERSFKQKINQETFECYHRANGPNRHLWNTSSIKRKHTFFS